MKKVFDGNRCVVVLISISAADLLRVSALTWLPRSATANRSFF